MATTNMKLKFFFVFVALVFMVLADVAYASPAKSPLKGTGITLKCVEDSESRFGIHRSIMMAIYAVEGGTNGLVSKNTNGTYDMGNFQINDGVWLETFERKFGVTRHDLITKPCVNYQAANYILWGYLKQQKSKDTDTWWKICRYHSGTYKFRKKYCDKLKREWYSLKQSYPNIMRVDSKVKRVKVRKPMAEGGVYKDGKMINMGSHSYLFSRGADKH